MHKHVLQSFVFFLLCVFNPLVGQDAHFTQFYNVPAFANPAFVGTSNSNYRVSTIYRDQWRTALEKPFSTFAVSGDLKFDGGGDAGHPDFLARVLCF
ncbi:MAG: type IX secretion system membrane protein PorP/SprF [Saprospiraceae bacterium]|nr:type IX secretion system membrane protein PorP/SprF [Saprospiraceae bacterium]